MRRLIPASIAAACCLAFVAFATPPRSAAKPVPNEAVYGLIFVQNTSNRSAWTDVSSSYKVQAGWRIEKAFCLKPGEYQNVKIEYNYSLGPQVRVRAEIKPGTGECTGDNIAWPQTQMNLDFPWRAGSVSVTAKVEGTTMYGISIRQEARR